MAGGCGEGTLWGFRGLVLPLQQPGAWLSGEKPHPWGGRVFWPQAHPLLSYFPSDSESPLLSQPPGTFGSLLVLPSCLLSVPLGSALADQALLPGALSAKPAPRPPAAEVPLSPQQSSLWLISAFLGL